MLQDHLVKLIAFYFPQFHRIPENDLWWGEGFTDWDNVKRGNPQFSGHYQPRVPLDDRYYDQSNLETLRWQIELAKAHGIHGFCHYHYWFEGKQLLETPTNMVLEDNTLDLPFCLAWANETWSRRWDGQDHHILQQQTHNADKTMWARHFEYLFRAWRDVRAIKIDGKPVFLIYRPHRIEKMAEMFDFWRELAHQRGLKGLYFIAIKQYEFPVPGILQHFNAVVHFQPFEALYSPDFPKPRVEASLLVKGLRRLPERILDLLRAARYQYLPQLTYYDYDVVWKQILKVEREAGIPAIPGAFVDWDNTARYGKRARIFKGASPERFEHWFQQLVKITAGRPSPEKMIFMNAWNEWSEGTYLEPDARYGLRYLEAVQRCLNITSATTVTPTSAESQRAA